jgi:hypothetical protein
MCMPTKQYGVRMDEQTVAELLQKHDVKTFADLVRRLITVDRRCDELSSKLLKIKTSKHG